MLNETFYLESANNFLKDKEIEVFRNQELDSRSNSLLPSPFKSNYVAVYTTPNGNCFYNSISLDLFGTERFYYLLKITILWDIMKNEVGYTKFVHDHAYTYEELVHTALLDRMYANETIIYAATKVLKRPIHSYDMSFGICQNITDHSIFVREMSNKRYVPHRYFVFDNQDSMKKALCIHHRNMHDSGEKNHFVALLPKTRESFVYPANQDFYYRKFGGDITFS